MVLPMIWCCSLSQHNFVTAVKSTQGPILFYSGWFWPYFRCIGLKNGLQSFCKSHWFCVYHDSCQSPQHHVSRTPLDFESRSVNSIWWSTNATEAFLGFVTWWLWGRWPNQAPEIFHLIHFGLMKGLSRGSIPIVERNKTDKNTDKFWTACHKLWWILKRHHRSMSQTRNDASQMRLLFGCYCVSTWHWQCHMYLTMNYLRFLYEHGWKPTCKCYSGQKYGPRYRPTLLVLGVDACRILYHNFRNHTTIWWNEPTIKSPTHSSWPNSSLACAITKQMCIF